MFRTLILDSFASIALCTFATAQIQTSQLPAGPHQPAPGPVSTLHRPAPPPSVPPMAFCFGDASAAACPCANTGLAGRGCDNSGFTGGSILWTHGVARLSADSVKLEVMGELPRSLSVVLQGNAQVRPAQFGDGLRCVGGSLKRLYTYQASNGMLTSPGFGELSISARSEALGDPIQQGDLRYYQVYYRDPTEGFCAAPNGSTFNVSNALAITWDS